MRLLGAALALLFWTGGAFAQIGLPAGQAQLYPKVGAAGFSGIGDGVSGAKSHFGAIAYSSATRGSNMMRICDSQAHGTGTCKDIASDSTTGLVSSTQGVGSIGTCGSGASQCYIDKLYDDSGANACSSASCDAVEVSANRPTFIPSASGSVPGIGCSSGAFLTAGTFSPGISVPTTTAASVSVPASPGGQNSFYSPDGTNLILGANTSLDVLYYNGGSNLVSSFALTANTFYAVFASNNSGTTTLYAKNSSGNSSGSGSSGTTTTSAAGFICDDAFSDNHTNTILEAFFYASALNSTQVSTLASTMRTNGGSF